MRYAARSRRLRGEGAFEVLAKAKALERTGKPIIHLEIGQPDFDTPVHIKDAGIRAIREGQTKYTEAQGIPQLRQAVARYVEKTRGIEVSPDEVMIAPGVKPILFFTMLICVNAGDEVMYPCPGFPTYDTAIRFIGGVPVPVPLIEERGFTMDTREMEKLLTRRTKLVIVNSPHNPTGGAVTADDLERIADMAVRNDLLVLSDEIYSRLMYDGSFTSIAALPGMKERTIIADGFSKTYAMTGWRLGYGVMNGRLVDYMTKLMINANSCTAMFTQFAGIEALNGPQDEVERMREAYRTRRDLIVEGLNTIEGFSCVLPKGAFYVFPNVKALGKKSSDLADLLLHEAGVACLPGRAFGPFGEGYLRFTYANSVQNIERALERISNVVKKM
ncbi:aspartate aminotransferase [candidate division TA06 bacterium DG_26]|uniref:Aminotransferase n=1 Tax=candidate division TA06 bacterium DG_26 TaxID=1703771 RepID=A0A0S7WLB4_UNCT6|nr:MAG: aspartate aminotransferase [candidate division TA06 bacterium DG_26]